LKSYFARLPCSVLAQHSILGQASHSSDGKELSELERVWYAEYETSKAEADLALLREIANYEKNEANTMGRYHENNTRQIDDVRNENNRIWKRLLEWYDDDDNSPSDDDGDDEQFKKSTLSRFTTFARKYQEGNCVTTYKEAKQVIIDAANAGDKEAVEFLIAKREQSQSYAMKKTEMENKKKVPKAALKATWGDFW